MAQKSFDEGLTLYVEWYAATALSCKCASQNDYERLGEVEKHEFLHFAYVTVMHNLSMGFADECYLCAKSPHAQEVEDRLCVWENLPLEEKLDALLP